MGERSDRGPMIHDGAVYPPAGAPERKMITDAWNELLALTKGHPNDGDILGVVHVLRANERRLGRVIQQQFAAPVNR